MKDEQKQDTPDTPKTEEPVIEADSAMPKTEPDMDTPEEEAPPSRKEHKAIRAELKKLRAESADLKKQLTDLQVALEEQKDKYLRTLAEYDNFRKRTSKERDGIYADAASDCVKNLLPLIDNLQRAAQYTESDKVVEGVQMILGTVPDVLGKMNITAFGAAGETFDPSLHNAVMHVEDDQHGEGEILEVFQCGYRHGDKIIRYAMVKVAN